MKPLPDTVCGVVDGWRSSALCGVVLAERMGLIRSPKTCHGGCAVFSLGLLFNTSV